jgi:hypothetical protein
LFVTFPFYYTFYNEFFDVSGNRNSQAVFEKFEFKPYLEYGISDDVSAGLSPSFQTVSQSNLTSTDRNSALVYTEVFLKKKIYEGESDVASVLGQIEIPGIYRELTTPFFGKKDLYAEARVLYGKNLPEIEGIGSFVNFEAGYRSRTSDTLDAESGAGVKFDLTLGMDNFFSFVDKDLYVDEQIYFKLNYFKTVSRYSNFAVLNRDGYDLLKYEVAFKTKFFDEDFEFSYYSDIYGKNTGNGQGIKISLWQNF